jgi:hypothetical protein
VELCDRFLGDSDNINRRIRFTVNREYDVRWDRLIMMQLPDLAKHIHEAELKKMAKEQYD